VRPTRTRYLCQFCGVDIREDFELNILTVQLGDVDPLIDGEAFAAHVNCNGSVCPDCMAEFEAEIRRAARLVRSPEALQKGASATMSRRTLVRCLLNNSDIFIFGVLSDKLNNLGIQKAATR
jgi:hypothetical protein